MIDRIIDNLFLLENITNHVPSVIEAIVVLLWIFLSRKSKTHINMH